MDTKTVLKRLIDKDLDITTLAKMIGTERSYLSRIIHRRRPGKNIWPRIARALDIELEEAA